MESFAERLAAGVRKSQTPTLVGLDPRFDSLPKPLTAGLSKNNPVEVASAFETFCKGVIDVVAPLVAVVKP
ncbi:MAG: orotidine 5'-phosphate decarboxylase, partial [Planctomycetota bacterium]